MQRLLGRKSIDSWFFSCIGSRDLEDPFSLCSCKTYQFLLPLSPLSSPKAFSPYLIQLRLLKFIPLLQHSPSPLQCLQHFAKCSLVKSFHFFLHFLLLCNLFASLLFPKLACSSSRGKARCGAH